MSLAKELRKLADRLDTPGAAAARRLRVPLDLYRCFARLKKDFTIRTVLDVGANRGEFARYAADCFPGAAVHCFEPLPGCQPLLRALAARRPQIKLHACALGETSGHAEMFENDYSPSSSLLPMQDRHRELWPKTAGAKIALALDTLDAMVARAQMAALFFLKLDVQGFELSVLRGGTETLRHTAAVMAEVLFKPFYAGQTDYRELLNFMAEREFRFVEFAGERRMPPLGKLVYADAVFVNERIDPLVQPAGK